MQVIEMVAQENYEMYQRVISAAEKYANSLNTARRNVRDEEYRKILDELAYEFEVVKRYVQYISQRHLKVSYVPPQVDYAETEQEK